MYNMRISSHLMLNGAVALVISGIAFLWMTGYLGFSPTSWVAEIVGVLGEQVGFLAAIGLNIILIGILRRIFFKEKDLENRKILNIPLRLGSTLLILSLLIFIIALAFNYLVPEETDFSAILVSYFVAGAFFIVGILLIVKGLKLRKRGLKIPPLNLTS